MSPVKRMSVRVEKSEHVLQIFAVDIALEHFIVRGRFDRSALVIRHELRFIGVAVFVYLIDPDVHVVLSPLFALVLHLTER